MNEELKNDASIEAQPDETTVLEVILTKAGAVKVKSIVINDKVTCLGFLEIAKQTLQKHWDSQEVKIHAPNHGIMNFIRNGKKH